MLTIRGTLMVSVASSLETPKVAVTLTTVSTGTAVARIVKVADEVPAAIVTVGGVVTSTPPLWLMRTVTPPVGAETLIVTVPVVSPGPIKLDGSIVSPVITGARTLSVSVSVAPTEVVAVMEMLLSIVVALVVMANVVVVKPAAIVTEAGTLAKAGWFDDKLITTPPTGAAPLSTIVPVELDKPP